MLAGNSLKKLTCLSGKKKNKIKILGEKLRGGEKYREKKDRKDREKKLSGVVGKKGRNVLPSMYGDYCERVFALSVCILIYI